MQDSRGPETAWEAARSCTITADASRCTRCGACVRVCPQGILTQFAGDAPVAQPDRFDSCLRCGHCVAVCPTDALCHTELEEEGFAPAPPAWAADAVLALLRSRRSVRRYAARGVPEGLVGALLEAARYAPTGHNAREVACAVLAGTEKVEPIREGIFRFYRRLGVLVRNPFTRPLVMLFAGRAAVGELLESLAGLAWAGERIGRGEDPLFHGAPAVLLFHAPRGRETSEADCAIAADHVTLLAPSYGLGTCHIGYAAAALKRLPGLARRCGVAGGRVPYAVLSVGFPDVVYCRLVPRPRLPVQFA